MPRTSPSGGPDAPADLILELVETLEEQGLGPDAYQLYRSVDVEALEQLVASASTEIEIELTVAGIRLSVTAEDVTVISDAGGGE